MHIHICIGARRHPRSYYCTHYVCVLGAYSPQTTCYLVLLTTYYLLLPTKYLPLTTRCAAPSLAATRRAYRRSTSPPPRWSYTDYTPTIHLPTYLVQPHPRPGGATPTIHLLYSYYTPTYLPTYLVLTTHCSQMPRFTVLAPPTQRTARTLLHLPTTRAGGALPYLLTYHRWSSSPLSTTT